MNKINYFYALGLSAFVLASCADKDVYDANYGNNEKVAQSNTFDFATTSTTSVSIQYQTGVSAFVPFEIYEENPITYGEGNVYTKDETILPLYTGYTDVNGLFQGSVTLPAYLSKVYVYTRAFYATQILEGTISNGALTITETAATTKSTASRAVENGTGSHSTIAVTDDGWKDLLGTYNGTSGRIGYALNADSKLTISKDKATALYGTFSNLTSKQLQEFVCESDMKLQAPAEVAITMLGGNTCWNSSLGYYYYEEGNAPKDYNEIKNKVILLIPNTQDGGWKIGQGAKYPWNEDVNKQRIGIDRGESVQLKYFGKYNEEKKAYEETDGKNEFPAGLKIGFVLAANAWSNHLDTWTSKRNQRSATSMAASRGYDKTGTGSNNRSPVDVAKTAVYRQGDYVMVSFEDDGQSNDAGKYTDVVFTTKTSPADAFDVKKLVTTVNEDETNKGLYCFEDLWPSQGDYDMNDAMAVYTHVKQTTLKVTTTTTTNSGGAIIDKDTKTEGPYLTGESFIFKTYRNHATLDNKLGFKITDPAGDLENAKITISKKTGVDKDNEDVFTVEPNFTREGDNVFLLGGISTDGSNVYKVSVSWSEPTLDTELESKIDCFLYRTGDRRWEVHVPFSAPSSEDKSLVDYTLFGKNDDCTDKEFLKGNWYTSSDTEYPFAFFLSGASQATVNKLLDSDNEGKRISVLYPEFLDWSTSRATRNTDWYK